MSNMTGSWRSPVDPEVDFEPFVVPGHGLPGAVPVAIWSVPNPDALGERRRCSGDVWLSWLRQRASASLTMEIRGAEPEERIGESLIE